MDCLFYVSLCTCLIIFGSFVYTVICVVDLPRVLYVSVCFAHFYMSMCRISVCFVKPYLQCVRVMYVCMRFVRIRVLCSGV